MKISCQRSLHNATALSLGSCCVMRLTAREECCTNWSCVGGTVRQETCTEEDLSVLLLLALCMASQNGVKVAAVGLSVTRTM
jgi:hypothetical protein